MERHYDSILDRNKRITWQDDCYMDLQSTSSFISPPAETAGLHNGIRLFLICFSFFLLYSWQMLLSDMLLIIGPHWDGWMATVNSTPISVAVDFIISSPLCCTSTVTKGLTETMTSGSCWVFFVWVLAVCSLLLFGWACAIDKENVDEKVWQNDMDNKSCSHLFCSAERMRFLVALVLPFSLLAQRCLCCCCCGQCLPSTSPLQ